MEAQRALLLCEAITNNKPWIVIGILNEHPQLITRPSASGDSILMMAVKKKSSVELINKLIQLMPPEGLAMTDDVGNTVLHVVESTQIATLLSTKSRDLLFVRNNSGETPLMTAIMKKCSFEYIGKIIEMTPVEGLCIQDVDGNTVLHMAGMTGDIELAKLLMKCPTLLLIRNNYHYLPIHLAVIQGHSHMQEYLLSVAEQKGYDDPYADVTREDDLRSAIRTGMNDVAVALSYNQPLLVSNLLREKENLHLLDDPVEDEKFRLLKAIMDGSQDEVESILNSNSQLTTTSLTAFGEMPILVATTETRSFDMIKIIVEHTSGEALAQTNNDGYTALHYVAILGSTQLATMLLSKCPNLLHISNNSGDLPINISIKNNHKDLTNYLFNKAKEEGYGDPFMGLANLNVLVSVLIAGMYDLASKIDQEYPDLAANSSEVLEFLAIDLSALRALQPFGCWKGKWITKLIYKNPNKYLWGRRVTVLVGHVLAAALLRILERIFRIELSVQRRTMLTSLCKRVADRGDDNAISVFTVPFLLAAKNGSETIVSEILTHHPNAIHFVDEHGHSIYHLAVMYRHENIFRIAYQSNVLMSRHLSQKRDNNGNHVLHLVGYPPNENRLVQSQRVILQMQRELKWFKELGNLLFPINNMQLNNEDKTPLAVFNEKHRDLVAKETQWMTSMAFASSMVASLIATVAFAAAITVPGGNNSNGIPKFSNHKSFIVFAVSDALALFASINCVISFLTVFTSRYGVDDFLYTLPNRLIIGLISLFISAFSLLVAFGATLFLVFGQQNYLILIPIIVFSCAPVIQYSFLQLPSLLNMIKSTYGGKLLV